MKSFQAHIEAIKKELSGFGLNIHHHQDRKQTAMLEILIEIRDQLTLLNDKIDGLSAPKGHEKP